MHFLQFLSVVDLRSEYHWFNSNKYPVTFISLSAYDIDMNAQI